MTGIVAISKQGVALAKDLSGMLGDSVCYTLPKWNQEGFEPIQGRLDEFCGELFERHRSLVFIMATGIVVRSIAPYIKDKRYDPAIVVLDEKGKNVISLLSGHLGGANALTHQIAGMLKANPVITTASDVNNVPSVDMLATSHQLRIDSMHDAKVITAMIVNGEAVEVLDEAHILKHPVLDKHINGTLKGRIIITNKGKVKDDLPYAKLIHQNIIIGVGCKRNTLSHHLLQFAMEVLSTYNLDERSIKAIVSVDLKSDEKAIEELVHHFNCASEFFSVSDLQRVEHLFQTSDFVKKTVGVGAVSAPAAFLAGKERGNFITEKIKKNGMTISVFECEY